MLLGWVMRKSQTSLTYRGDKMHERYQVYKKNFSLVKNALDLFEEFEYIRVCLWETLNIIGSYYRKKIFPEKNGL